MKKRIGLLLLIIIIVLTSCSATRSSYSLKNYDESFTNINWSMTYGYFDGYTQRQLIPESGKTAYIVDIGTDSGSLAVKITDESGASYADEDYNTEASFELELDSDKTYTVRFTGDKHSGYFNVRPI